MPTKSTPRFSPEDEAFMRRALDLARRGYGGVSPNPMVGAVLAKKGQPLGEGYHHRAGEPHAEVLALRDARSARGDFRGATLYVTLEPCSTHGRTPPCSDAILAAGISRVVVAARDPNPKHAGAGLRLLRSRGVRVEEGLLRDEAERLNEVFNHWIVERRPFVHLKCASSLDGKIATNTGESKWITGLKARAYGMRLRLGSDAIAVGVHTILRDDPALTIRRTPGLRIPRWKTLRRIVLDPEARTPPGAKVVTDAHASLTTIVVGSKASARRVAALLRRVRVLEARLLPNSSALDLAWMLRQLESEGVTSLLVEGGGETHFNFLAQSLVDRVHFLYAPLVITGRDAPRSVGGPATLNKGRGIPLRAAEWSALGKDLLLTARLAYA